MTRIAIALILFLSSQAFGATTRTVNANTFATPDGTKTWAVPVSTGGNIVATATADTLTNKTIDGSTNTLSKLPIASQINADIFYGNGSTTSLTLSNSTGTAAAPDLRCYMDGAILVQGIDYSYTAGSATVTMTTAPSTGQIIKCVYSKF